MEVDEALVAMGAMGRWQLTYYTVICIAVMFPNCWYLLAFTYIAAKPEHHCKVPINSTKELSIPFLVEKNAYSECEMYVGDGSNATTYCTEWEYFGDTGDTIVSKWDLVCDHKHWRHMTQSIQVAGIIFGALIFTCLSDRFGRKPVFLFSQWALVIFGVANAFSNTYYDYVALRFIIGAFQQGVMLPGFVMACELFPAKHRTFAGITIENFWAVAVCLLALFAYLIRDWVYLEILISLPGILTVPLYWWLPESIPWLCANGRVDEAENIIRNAAKMNGVEMPEHILSIKESFEKIVSGPEKNENACDGKATDKSGSQHKKPNSILAKFNDIKIMQKHGEKQEDVHTTRYTLLDVFRNKRLTIYAISVAFLWMVTSLVYYGLSLSAGDLAGDRYINNFFSGLVEIPAYIATFFILRKWGRRRPLVAFYVVAGVALILSQLTPAQTGEVSLVPLQFTFNMIGKFGITASFAIIFLYAPEIFPTTLRSQALGIASVAGRIGSMVAPFNQLLMEAVPWLPGPLLGIVSILGGLVTLLLPETSNRPLPQTIEDIENWSKVDSSSPETKDQQELSLVGYDSAKAV